MQRTTIAYSELLPHEFRARLAAMPLAYLPLGTLEWHGEHLPYGSDAIQSEGLMRICADSGQIERAKTQMGRFCMAWIMPKAPPRSASSMAAAIGFRLGCSNRSSMPSCCS